MASAYEQWLEDELNKAIDETARLRAGLCNERTAQSWFQRVHGDNEGPFSREEMIAAYRAGYRRLA